MYILEKYNPSSIVYNLQLGTSPLHLAAQNNNVDVCEVLLRGGISKDARNKVDRTPLHLAAFEGYYQVAETLIKHGADVNCKDMVSYKCF